MWSIHSSKISHLNSCIHSVFTTFSTSTPSIYIQSLKTHFHTPDILSPKCRGLRGRPFFFFLRPLQHWLKRNSPTMQVPSTAKTGKKVACSFISCWPGMGMLREKPGFLWGTAFIPLWAWGLSSRCLLMLLITMAAESMSMDISFWCWYKVLRWKKRKNYWDRIIRQRIDGLLIDMHNIYLIIFICLRLHKIIQAEQLLHFIIQWVNMYLGADLFRGWGLAQLRLGQGGKGLDLDFPRLPSITLE